LQSQAVVLNTIRNIVLTNQRRQQIVGDSSILELIPADHSLKFQTFGSIARVQALEGRSVEAQQQHS
jgi:hypothetical protein